MSALTKWSPFRLSPLWDPLRELEEMRNRFFPVLDRRLPMLRSEPKEWFTPTEWMPPVDIEEDDREYLLKVELPGMKKEDVNLKVEGGTLSISGERKAEKEEKDKKHHRIERSYGAFVRSFALPEAVLTKKVSAEFKDGVLLVHLPKDERAKPKAIGVKVS
jgi:HSP20 family protein